MRGLDFHGVSPATHGVRIISGAAVIIDESTIRRFNSSGSFGISFQPSRQMNLYISNTTITENGSGSTGGGILVQPTGSLGGARVFLDDVRVLNNANAGMRVDTNGLTNPFGVIVDINDSAFVRNADGLFVNVPSGSPLALVMAANSNFSNNTATGISSAGSSGSVIRVGSSTITGNTTGVLTGSGGIINSYQTNRLDGNSVDGAFTGVIPQE